MNKIMSCGKFDIPEIFKDEFCVEDFAKEWISFNYAKSEKCPADKNVHFFLDDYQFDRCFNNFNNLARDLSLTEFKRRGLNTAGVW